MEVTCPWCGNEVRLDGQICPECRHEVLPEHLATNEGASHSEGEAELDSSVVDDINEAYEIEKNYTCAKCGHDECKTAEVAMTGTGLSKLMDVQHHHYLFVSCLRCGIVDIYDPSVLRGRQAGVFGTILDLL